MYCPWIGARLGLGPRLLRMVEIALHGALAPLEAAFPGEIIPAFVCTAAPRPGLVEADRIAVERAVQTRARAREIHRCTGAASVFTAILDASALLERGDARAVLVIAVDSYVCEAALAAHVERPPSPWSDDVPPLSEAAVALVLARPTDALRLGGSLGTLHGTATFASESTDDNDALVDGTALTAAIGALPAAGPVALVVGQERVDTLRRREWHLASARRVDRLSTACVVETPERDLGRIGAASGAMSLAYGFAAARHGISANVGARAAPFLAWAISRDGTRGIALARGAAT